MDREDNKRPDVSGESKGIVKEEEVCICFNLRKAARVVTQIYDNEMRPLGFRATQITLLGVVSKFQPITVKQLSDFIDTDPTTLLRNLRLMEQRKILKIEKSKKDGRQRVVRITDKGTKLLMKAYPVWKATQDRIAEAVGRKELYQLLADLESALQSIPKKENSQTKEGDL